MEYFDLDHAITFEGADSRNPLAFRHYQADEVVLGKPMRDHLRFAICYWHNLVWEGADVFGANAFPRKWNSATLGDPMAQARAKADAAFELFGLLGVPYLCFDEGMCAPRVILLRKATGICG